MKLLEVEVLSADESYCSFTVPVLAPLPGTTEGSESSALLSVGGLSS